jgi:CRISPR/Cas system CSM-associated protein Csm3 (group 7 of RAMP superfamily)
MPRKLSSRLLIKGKLAAISPLHVGGLGGNVDVDMVLAVNGSGNLYVPGTSLAGPIRAWLRARVGEARIKGLWGFQEPPPRDRNEERQRKQLLDLDTDNEDDLGRASSVFVEDGVVELPDDLAVEIRDGVGINRVTGAAAESIKYDRAVLPIGSRINFEMTVELTGEEAIANDDKAMIGVALGALQNSELRFGAARSRGLGRVRLEGLSIREQRLSNRAGILALLRGEDHPLEIEQLGVCELTAQPSLKFVIAWKPRGPIMVKSERDGIAMDMLPLVSATNGKLAFVLPGSSIKGALRSQAERIIRTVCEIAAPRVDPNPKRLFQKQIELSEVEHDDEEYQRSLIGALFGAAGKESKLGDPDDRDESKGKKLPPLLGASAVTIEDCYSRQSFTPQQWEQIEMASEIELNHENSLLRALQSAGLNNLQPAYHVAVDRWTGGAADGCLYTVLEPHGLIWNEIEMSLDLTRIREEERDAAIACLLLTLRDFVAGRIPLGFGVNRGMGAVEVLGLEITPRELTPNDPLNQLNQLKVESQSLVWGNIEARSQLNRAWSDWIEYARKQKGALS